MKWLKHFAGALALAFAAVLPSVFAPLAPASLAPAVDSVASALVSEARAVSMTDALENSITDWFFRAQAFTPPATIHVGLLTAACSDSAAGTEVTGGSYARVAVTSSLANWAGTQGAGTTVASSGNSGTTSNNAAITYPSPTANWGTVTHFALYSASTGGTVYFCAALTQSKTINNGDAAPSFSAGALTVQIDN
jgi:hypothetical protein